MRRRRKKRASELTPLVDVLFILLFAALIQARGVASPSEAEQPADEPVPAQPSRDAMSARDAAVPDDALPPDDAPDDVTPGDAAAEQQAAEQYRTGSLQAAEVIASAVGNKPVAVLEIRSSGLLTAVTFWSQGQKARRDELSYPLLYEVPGDESDYELDYRGDTNERHRLCAIVRDHLHGAGALSEAGSDAGAKSLDIVVLVTTDTPFSDMPLALHWGLLRDSEWCSNQARGLVIFVEPSTLIKTQNP